MLRAMAVPLLSYSLVRLRPRTQAENTAMIAAVTAKRPKRARSVLVKRVRRFTYSTSSNRERGQTAHSRPPCNRRCQAPDVYPGRNSPALRYRDPTPGWTRRSAGYDGDPDQEASAEESRQAALRSGTPRNSRSCNRAADSRPRIWRAAVVGSDPSVAGIAALRGVPRCNSWAPPGS